VGGGTGEVTAGGESGGAMEENLNLSQTDKLGNVGPAKGLQGKRNDTSVGTVRPDREDARVPGASRVRSKGLEKGRDQPLKRGDLNWNKLPELWPALEKHNC